MGYGKTDDVKLGALDNTKSDRASNWAPGPQSPTTSLKVLTGDDAHITIHGPSPADNEL